MGETVYENQFQVLYMYIGPDQQFKHKLMFIFSIICLNICLGAQKNWHILPITYVLVEK